MDVEIPIDWEEPEPEVHTNVLLPFKRDTRLTVEESRSLLIEITAYRIREENLIDDANWSYSKMIEAYKLLDHADTERKYLRGQCKALESELAKRDDELRSKVARITLLEAQLKDLTDRNDPHWQSCDTLRIVRVA